MNKFKLTILAVLMGFTASAQAADNNNQNDKRMNNSDTAVMGDCSSMVGKEKGMCEKAMNTRTNKDSTERSRINKNRNTNNDINNRSESSSTDANGGKTNAPDSPVIAPSSDNNDPVKPIKGTGAGSANGSGDSAETRNSGASGAVKP